MQSISDMTENPRNGIAPYVLSVKWNYVIARTTKMKQRKEKEPFFHLSTIWKNHWMNVEICHQMASSGKPVLNEMPKTCFKDVIVGRCTYMSSNNVSIRNQSLFAVQITLNQQVKYRATQVKGDVQSCSGCQVVTLSEINRWMNVDISRQTDSIAKPALNWLSIHIKPM